MTAGLNAVRLSAELSVQWDARAMAWDTAWFWQTTTWIRYATFMAADALVSGHSFVLVNSAGEVVALCPVNVEERNGQRSFAFMGGPLPAPAFDPRLTQAEWDIAAGLYASTLAGLARDEHVTYGSLRMPFTGALTPSHHASNRWPSFGYFDLPYLTRVIDLRRSEEALWADIRKGHRSDIKKATKQATVQIWDGATLTDAKVDEYRLLHAKDAGRVTRPRKTFEMMGGWIRAGHAVLAEASVAGEAVAFAVIIYYKAGAYYGSGCRDPERMEVPASHLVQWEVIRWLKVRGCALYDVGQQFHGPQWFYVPTAKELSIAAYKRGFGGTTVPLVTAERFYSAATMGRTFDERVRAFAAATGLHD